MRTTDTWPKWVSNHFLEMPSHFFYFHPALLPRMDKIFKYNSHLLEIPINQRYFGNRLL